MRWSGGECAPEAGCSHLPALPPSACASTPQVHVARAAEYAGSRDFAVTARDCVFESNVLNVTGAVAAQGSLSVGLKLLGSGEMAHGCSSRLGGVASGHGQATPAACRHATCNLHPNTSPHPSSDQPTLPHCLLAAAVIQNNSLMAVGAAAVGATGKASIQLSERTVVAGNNAALWGALVVGGDGTLDTQLAGGANVTGNTLTEVG